MDTFLDLLQKSYFGNTLNDYIFSLGIFLLALLFFKFTKNKVLLKLERWAKKTKTDLDDEFIATLETIPIALYFFASLYIALQFIEVHSIIVKFVDVTLIVLLIYWSTNAIAELIEYGLAKMTKGQNGRREKNTTYFALSLIAKIILWSVGLLLILSNLGVNISALVASLGIGGIAIALALQNILGDIFSSFSIYIDKPFEVGDFIIVGDHQGTVKRIGLKTTRIQALQGEEIVIANNELTSTRVRNFKQMKKRRIVFNIKVTYNTKPAKLNKIPKLIKEVIAKIKICTFDRAHLVEFGDFSLNFEIVYFLKSGDYKEYMDAQHKMNMAIIKTFEKEKIEMAFPTQTLHIHQQSS